jgi:hypothetical protein
MRKMDLVAGAGALAEYTEWFGGSRAGDVVVYYRGDLQFDRDPDNFPGLDAAQMLQMSGLSALADAVRRDAGAGYLILNQRKIGESNYEYLATRRLSPTEQLFQKA